jgi:hypothetical protein
MLSRIWLINVVLALFVVFFVFKAYGVWVPGNKERGITEMAKKTVKRTPKPTGALNQRKIPAEATYDALMTLNLFAPERKEILPEAAKPDERSKKLSAAEQKNIQQYFSKLVLYGLVITNNSAEALVSHPVAKPVIQGRKTTIPKNRSRNIKRLTVKQTKWVKAGDNLGDFKVVSVEPDRVMLKVGDQSYDLLLYDKNNLKKRAAPKPKAGPNVVGVTTQPKTTPKAAGARVKSKAVPKVPEAPAKSPVVFKRGTTSIPLPTKGLGKK